VSRKKKDERRRRKRRREFISIGAVGQYHSPIGGADAVRPTLKVSHSAIGFLVSERHEDLRTN
jgi:hypothetical protein